MAGSRYGLRQCVVGLLAVVVILACGVIMRRQWIRLDPKRPRPAQSVTAAEQLRLKPTASAAARSDAATVEEWRLAARPFLAPPDAPALTQRRTARLTVPLPRREDGSRRVPELRPAVAVDLDVVLSAQDGQTPALWPGLATLRLLRGEAAAGPFSVVREVSRAAADAAAPDAGRRLGTEVGFHTYQLVVLDLSPELGMVRAYKVQMVGPAGDLLAESGVCTGLALPVPAVAAAPDAQGRLTLSWSAPARPAAEFVDGPWLVVGASAATQYLAFEPQADDFHELGRFPMAAGTFALPIPIGDASVRAEVAQIGVVGALRRQVWSQSVGSHDVSLSFGLTAVVTGRPGWAAYSKARPDPQGHALLPTAESRSGYTPGQRPAAVQVLCKVARPATLKSLTVHHARTGVTETVSQQRLSDSALPAGLGERCVYTLTVASAEGEKTLNASVYAPPLPTGLRTVAAPDAIRLAWDPLRLEPGDWAAEPMLVVRRLPATEALSGYGRDPHWPTTFAEIGRVSASASEFTDRNVVAGAEYFYALDLEGVTRTSGTLGDLRDLPINVWVCSGTGSQSGPPPLLAKAEASGPVRVALDAHLANSVRSAAAREALATRLRREPWLRLVERAEAGRLLDEGNLGALAETAATGTPAAVQAADVVVDCTERESRGTRHLEVGLTEVRQSRRQVLGAWPAADLPWDDVATALAHCLKTRFPDWEQRAARATATATASPPARLTVAVLALEPVLAASDDTLPGDLLQGLLTTALSASGQWDVVDRERLAAVLAEQGLAATLSGPSALALGRLVNADAMLTGTYALKQGKITLSAWLVSVRGGQHLASVEANGSSAGLEAVAQQLAAALASASLAPEAAGSDSAAQRAMEVRTMVRGYGQLEAAKTAAYVGNENRETLERLAQEYDQKHQPEDALNCYRRALALAEKATSAVASDADAPAGLREQIDGLLRRLGRPQDRVALWRQALERPPAGPLATTATLRLAQALADAGNPVEALTTLQHSREPQKSAEAGILYARLGDVPTAIDTLLGTRWFGSDRLSHNPDTTALGPAYATVIRLLDVASPEQRRRLLDGLVSQLGAERPVQTLRALAELRQAGPLPLNRLPMVLDAALSIGAATTAAALVQDLQTRQPEDLALLKALSAAAETLRRYGRQDEEAALAKRALDLPVKGDAAGVVRTVLKRRFEASQQRPAKPTAKAAGPGIDDELWTYLANRGGRATAPDSDLYVLTETGFLLRLTEANRRLVWQYDLGFRKPYPHCGPETPRQHALKTAENGFWVTPETVYACNFADGVVHAVDAATGKARWTHTEWTAVSPPLVRPNHDTCVCVANSFGELVILGAKDGHLIKRVPVPPELEGRYAEDLPDLIVIHDNRRDEPVHWTDWIQISLDRGGHFAKRNYWGLRGDAQGLVYIDANPFGGTHHYHMVTGEIKIIDLTAKDGGSTAAWETAMADRDTGARHRQVDLAERTADPQKTLPTLLKILRDPDEDEDTRKQTIEPILSLGEEEGVNAVIDALEDPAYGVRSEAHRALYNCAMFRVKVTPAALGRLAKIAHGKDEDRATRALGCLVHLGGLGIKPLIQDILDGPDSPARTRAALALAEEGDVSMLPLLRPLLRADVPTAKQLWIVQILSALGDPKARALYIGSIDTALWLAKAADVTQRGPTSQEVIQAEMLVQGIAEFAPDEALVPFLEELTTYYGGRLTPRVCAALGRIAAPRSVPFLIALLPPPDQSTRTGTYAEPAPSAWQALIRLAGEDHGMQRANWQQWWEQHRAEFENRPKPPAP